MNLNFVFFPSTTPMYNLQHKSLYFISKPSSGSSHTRKLKSISAFYFHWKSSQGTQERSHLFSWQRRRRQLFRTSYFTTGLWNAGSLGHYGISILRSLSRSISRRRIDLQRRNIVVHISNRITWIQTGKCYFGRTLNGFRTSHFFGQRKKNQIIDFDFPVQINQKCRKGPFPIFGFSG